MEAGCIGNLSYGNPNPTSDIQCWQFFQAPITSQEKTWRLPEYLADNKIPLLLRTPMSYLHINEDFKKQYYAPGAHWWGTYTDQRFKSLDPARSTFYLVSANFDGQDGYMLVSTLDPETALSCGEYCVSAEKRKPGNDANFFITFEHSTANKGAFFVNFPKKGNKSLDGYTQTNLMITAQERRGGMEGFNAWGFSWSFIPYGFNPNEWPVDPLLNDIHFSLQFLSGTDDLCYMGAESLAPLGPGTKLIVTPYLPRHGMNYKLEPTGEKSFRFVSADNPLLCLSIDSIEEDTFVSLTDQRGPNTVLIFEPHEDELRHGHFHYYKFKQSGLFLSVRTVQNQPIHGSFVVQDYKSDRKSLWRLLNA